MTATITKTEITRNIGLMGRRGKKTFTAWIVEGQVDGHPYEIETLSEDRAAQYAAAIDAGDDDAVDAMLAEEL